MSKKKSDFAALAEFADRQITEVRLNGAQVTIASQHKNDADGTAAWKVSLPEYPTQDFVDALAALKTYVTDEAFRLPSSTKTAWLKGLQIRAVIFKHNGGEVKAKVIALRELFTGYHVEFRLPEIALLARDEDGKFLPETAEAVTYSEGTTLKLEEVMKQGKLYLAGHRSQLKLPLAEADGKDNAE